MLGNAGTLGFLITTAVVAAMYIAFIFSFTELTTAIPQAGGPFAYSAAAPSAPSAGASPLCDLDRVQCSPPPAIALAIGAYLNVQFPGLDPKHAATRRPISSS